MTDNTLPRNQILQGDCVEILNQLPAESVDVVFADPPYNLQLNRELWRPNLTQVDAVNDSWDQFDDFATYDTFTEAWLTACRRVLKPTGTLWVIGSYHNIYRVGAILQNLKYWMLNDVVWIKSNPMPNFRGVRFTNAHETLIWAQRDRGATYTFNHHALKQLNENLQMRSDWYLPICTGKERLRENGEKVHSTQKPLALLYRILIASTQKGDVVLDPFFGTGTTGVAAKQLQRDWIGIEREARYVEFAGKRINETQPFTEKFLDSTPDTTRRQRLPFGTLVEHGLIKPGKKLYFHNKEEFVAEVMADGSLKLNGQRGSIHQIARKLQPGPVNGWLIWYYQDDQNGSRYPVDRLRQNYKEKYFSQKEDL